MGLSVGPFAHFLSCDRVNVCGPFVLRRREKWSAGNRCPWWVAVKNKTTTNLWISLTRTIKLLEFRLADFRGGVFFIFAGRDGTRNGI